MGPGSKHSDTPAFHNHPAAQDPTELLTPRATHTTRCAEKPLYPELGRATANAENNFKAFVKA